MKSETKYKLLFILTACCTLLAACTKMDEYKKFSAGKEVLYTGKADSVKTYSGKKRIKLSWLHASDPKVVKTRIFWNNRTDSTDVLLNNATLANGRHSILISNLAEGNYNFELFNYDKDGNRSVVSRTSGSVYGENFEKSLLNRAISGFGKQFDADGSTAITWYNSDAQSLGLELTYSDNAHNAHKIIVAPNVATTILADYDINVPISYRTMFLPDSAAIDTFYAVAALKTVTNPNEINIKNSGYPFKPGKVIGRWSDLATWTANDAVKNHGGVGGLDNLNTSTENYMSFEFWGTPQIINGKVYQTGSLLPGSYRLVVTISNINNNLENSYLSIAKGSTLPDVADINTSLVNVKLTNGSMNNKDITLSFSMSEQGMVSLGVVSTMQFVNESSLRIKQFRLYKDN
ncbi:DUF4998 domain-containing protein [Mucilaginibacter sp.]|uniref:DUF4998 domain-containing protein n=1 Tax=Mucilaginibacter sp. TaxID=1882438 RepID=UPI00326429EF